MVMNVTPVNGTDAQIAQALLTEILGDTTGLSNIRATIKGRSEAFGKFTGDSFGLSGGIVLSTGVAQEVVGPNQVENLGKELEGDATSNGGLFDETVLTITFDAASANRAYFAYVFGSDEFIEYGGTEYNDKFELLINGQNMAKLSNGSEISVNSLVPDPDDSSTWQPEFIDNTGGKASNDTELDGYTKFMNFEANLQPGTNTITIRIKDVGDNTYDSAVFIKKGSLSVIKPVPPVPPPAPTSLDMTGSTDTPTLGSPSTTDNRTYDATPDFAGTGSKVGNKIKLFSDFEGQIGEAIVQANGTWTVTSAAVSGQELLVGSHKIYAIEYDATNGLASPKSSVLDVYIDSPARSTDILAPNAPSQPDLTDATDTINSFGVSSNIDNDTDRRTPTFTGTAEIDSVVTLYSNKEGAIGSVRVGRDGKWAINASLLQSGEHVITAKATDQANNTSLTSAGLNIFVRNVPSVPNMTDVSDTGHSKTDNITRNSAPTFTGKAEANTDVEVFVYDASNASVLSKIVTTNAQGKWSFTPDSGLTEGSYTIRAHAKNRQTSTYDDFSNALSFTIDTTVASQPSTPDLAAVTDNGLSNTDNITSIKSPQFTGTSDPGAFVTVISSLNGILGTVQADAAGKWSLHLSNRQKLEAGDHEITAVAEDLAGNQSLASPALKMTSLPDVSMPDLLTADDTGASNSDNITRKQTLQFTGTAELESKVTLFYVDGGVEHVLGTATVTEQDADGNGLWMITADADPNASGNQPLLEGVYNIQAKAQKSRLNSLISNPLKVTIDIDGSAQTLTPSTPDLAAASDLGQSNSDDLTSKAKPTFTGTVTAGDRVEVFIDDASAGFAAVSGTTWTFTPGTSLAHGNYVITAQAIDPAGNKSLVSSSLPFTIDRILSSTRPDMTAATDSQGVSSSDNITSNPQPGFIGTVDADVTQVEILLDGLSQGLATLNGTDWQFTPSSSLAQGNHTIIARALDRAGNISPDAPLNFTIDTVALTPAQADLTASSDSGFSNTDNLTNKTKPNFTGTLPESAMSVEVFIDGVSRGSATVSGGNWNFTPGADLTDGNHTIAVKLTDVAGNVSSLSPALNFAIDATLPATPAIAPDLTAASDTGISDSDNITSNTQPTFTGTAANDAVQVEVFIDGVSQGLTNTTGGNWSYRPSAALADKVGYVIAVKAVDAAGNASALSPGLSFTIDSAMAKPAVTKITDDTGASSTDRVTRDSTLVFSGPAEANSTVTITLGSNAIGTVIADSAGRWTLDYTGTSLADGAYVVKAQSTDKAGNTAVSNNFNLTVDTVAPGNPVITGISTDTGASGSDGVTSDRTLLINGTAEASSTVDIFQGETKIGTVTTDSMGQWTLDYQGTTLSDGSYVFSAKSTDKAGNISTASPNFNVQIDSAAPGKPVIALISEDTGTLGDGITSDNRLFITGTAEANSSVDVFRDGNKIGATTADSQGNWTLDYTGTALADNNYVLTARSIDAAGNVSVASDSFNLKVDTSISTPSAPDLLSSSDSGDSSTDNITNLLQPEFQGTAEANSRIQLMDDLGNVIGTGTADAAGSWQIKSLPVRKGVQKVKAIATDAAGNISPASSETQFTLDDAAPAKPAMPDLTDASDTGTFSSDNITGNDRPDFSGAAEPGSTVKLYSDIDGLVGTAIADGSGRWQLTAGKQMRKGAHKIKVQAIDKAGNISPDSDELSLQILTVELSINQTTLSEAGGSAIVTATLAAATHQDVTVHLGMSGTASGSDYSLPTSIVIRAGQTTGSVELSGIDDFLAEGAESAVINITRVDNAVANGVQQVTATLTDNDVAGVTVTPISISTDEGGLSGTFNVVLTSQPTEDVIITLNHDATEGILSTTALTFTAANWNQVQTVTVTGKDDDLADGAITYNIGTTASSSDANYSSIDVADVTVINADNDSAGITITPINSAIIEGGKTGSYSILLNSQPTDTVTVSLSNGAQTRTDVTTLTFTPSSWNVAQTVQVAAVDDAIAEGNHTGAIAHTVTSIDSRYNGLTAPSVTANIIDNDSAGIVITQSGGNTQTAEGGATDTYTVSLSSQPIADVTITINNGSQTNTDVQTLTFTPSSWNVAQTVTVAAVNDSIVEGSHSGIISHRAASTDANYSGMTADVTVAIADRAGVRLIQSNDSTIVTEGGATDTYTLVLNSQPTGDVIVTLNPDRQASADQDIITFTPQNWNIAQTVTVTAVDDAVMEGSHSGTITHTVSSTDSNYNGATLVPVNITIGDNDRSGIIITPVDSETGEDGSTGAFQVVLSSQPTADVILNFDSTDSAEGLPAQRHVIFNSTNWNTAQTVTVTGRDDAWVDGDRPFAIQTTVESGDRNYDRQDVTALNFTNLDNDKAGVVIQGIDRLTTGENGNTATFSLVLTSRPTADVTINLTSSNTAEGRVPASITFTPEEWNLPQTVTIAGVDDSLVDGDIQYQIQTSITSADTNYAMTDPADVQVTNLDNEFNAAPTAASVKTMAASRQGIRLSGLGSTDLDGSISHYTIKLPDARQGVLYLGNPATDGVLLEAERALRPEQVGQLFFQSSSAFQGVQFTYTVTDNLGKTSAPATVTLGTLTAQSGCFTKKGFVLKGSSRNDRLKGSINRDRLIGGGGNDVLKGGSSNDNLQGRKGSDRLFGQECDDTLSGGFGNDRLSGGQGFDRLSGGRGNDRMRGGDQNDILKGGAGNDVLRGGTGNDLLKGSTGSDRFFGGQGSDVISGGRGDDRMRGGQGNDKIGGGLGRDRLFGGGGDDKLSGGLGNDGLRGGSGDDILKGGVGRDRLEGSAGNDLLKGGRGNDLLDGGRGHDALRGGSGRDVLKGRQGDDSLSGGRGHDTLRGGGGSDVLQGNQGNDRLLGGGQSDRLIGGTGNDQITGGRGDDVLSGGTGRDRFIYTKLGEKLGDRITDFEVDKDVLDIRRLLGKANINAKSFNEAVKLLQTGANTTVQVDLNGKAAGGFETLVTLENVNANSLTAKNIV